MEVLRQLDSQALRRADGHVDAAGEVSVQRHSVHRDQGQDVYALVLVRAAGQGPDHCHETVRHHQLFEEAPQHSLQPKSRLGGVPPVLRQQGGGQRVIAADGALNELWEEGDEQGKFP